MKHVNNNYSIEVREVHTFCTPFDKNHKISNFFICVYLISMLIVYGVNTEYILIGISITSQRESNLNNKEGTRNCPQQEKVVEMG